MMTKETILARLLEVNAHGTYGTEFLDKQKFSALVKDLEDDIMEESNRVNGKTKPMKLAKAILSVGQKREHKTGIMDLMAYAYTDDNGIQWLVDGYRVVGFFDNLELPEVPEDDRARWFHLDKMVEAPYDDVELPLPDIAELKGAIKIGKAKKKHTVWKFEFGGVFNAQYLLEYLEGLENVKLYAQLDRRGKIGMTSPLRIEADNGIGILLGINNKVELPNGINYL